MYASRRKIVRPIRNPNIIWRTEGNQILAFNPDTGDVTVFNQTAAKIWELCDGSHNLDDICRIIRLSFKHASSKDVRKDVQEFIAQAREAKLISNKLCNVQGI